MSDDIVNSIDHINGSQKELTREIFFDEVRSYIRNEDSLKLITKAYDFAKEKHKDQKRKSGEPYFNHLLAVAYELARYKVGPKTICAGLLHDCMEDQGVSKEELTELFGEEITFLVDSVTKIGGIKFKDEAEYQAANHRKILFAMAKDIRVILIKLADRLHNMRTLDFQPPHKQKKIAQETLDVYAPMAHRLGIAEIEHELENLSFYYLDREHYEEVIHLLNNKKSERDEQIQKMINEISKILSNNKIPFRIFGRSKEIYSIYKKMIDKNKRFDEILDLLAIRIITKTELNCYEILGFIHATFHPIPGRFKDYIAMPKVNMYQSLHTTIVGNDGGIYEVQIRTEAMDEIAERGIAAHWSYKEGKGNAQGKELRATQDELDWLRNFDEDFSDSDDPQEFMSTVTHDVFNANIYVMTPKGRVIDLVQGATPIDFAYRIHTEVGNQTVGAIVNGILVPLNTPLKTGDVIEVKTNKNSEPSSDWLSIVKTTTAKNKIKAYLTKKENEEKEALAKTGEQIFKEDMKRRQILEEEYTDHKKIEALYSSLGFSTSLDFYYAIACKSLSTQSIAEKLVKQKKNEVSEETLKQITSKVQARRKASSSKTGVLVAGDADMKTELATCCTPVFSDEIVGFVSRGKGIKVHRAGCPNATKDPKRIISVSWDEEYHGKIKYEANIRIFSSDRNFLLTDLVTCVSQYKANLLAVNSKVNSDHFTTTTSMTIIVDDLEHLETIMTNLRKVSSVTSVERVIK